jgi:hypothetical protein
MLGFQPSLPAHRCPLCGGPNACAPAASGDLSTPCWCRHATFSSELLEQIPPDQRGLACVCAACATQSQHHAKPS